MTVGLIALLLFGQLSLAGGQPTEAVKEAAKTAKQDSKAKIPADNKSGKTDVQDTHPITVAGRAVGQDGKPIAGAEVFLAAMRPFYGLLAETKTEADGSYKFEKVPLPIDHVDKLPGHGSGAFEVFGIADGYALTWRPEKTFLPGRKHYRDYQVPDPKPDLPRGYGSEEPIKLDLTFGPAKSIRGRVVDDRGLPIAKAKLEIRYCDTDWDRKDFNIVSFNGSLNSLNSRATVPASVKNRVTNEDGRFEFTGLPDGYRWSIDVRPPGHSPRKIWAMTRAEVDTTDLGTQVYGNDFTLVFSRPRMVKLRVVYGDTGEPAAKVGVGGGSSESRFWETTDPEGCAVVLLPDGPYEVSIIPRYRTLYWRTETKLVVSNESVAKTTILKLNAAAVLDITVLDADARAPISGVDVWLDEQSAGSEESHRRVHGYRSWEVETNISHGESPRSDKQGKMRVLFEPGKQRIGVGLERPKDYEPVESNGKELELQSGTPTAVTFEMRKKSRNSR